MKSRFPATIPTTALTLLDVPEGSASWSGDDATAPWKTISKFALTFDPAEHDPYHLAPSGLSGVTPETSLVLLRAYLFFEQRRWNHFGRPIDEKSLAEVRRLVALIRSKLEARDRPQE